MNSLDLFNQIKAKRSFLCVGLDPDINKLPDCVKSKENPIFEFNKEIIKATAQYAVAFKPNMAFYESEGIKGWQALIDTVAYIKKNHPEIFIIADAKRGDIGNTSSLYAEAFFKEMDCDAITLAPYMGKDTVEPFLKYKGKWSVLLALTSNSSSNDFQMIKDTEGKFLYEKVLETSKTWGDENNMMYVVGATKAETLSTIRKIIPNHFLLVPGVGAQGGSLQDVAKYGINKQVGLLVNSSRGIIFADNSENFAKVAEVKAKELADEMNAILKEYNILD